MSTRPPIDPENKQTHKGGFRRSLDENGLTELEENFCISYVYVTGMSAEQSVLDAGYGCSEPNIKAQIRFLFKNKAVLRRINQLVEERNNQVIVDRLYVINRFKELADQSKGKNPNIEIKALENLGKFLGMYETRNTQERSDSPSRVMDEIYKQRVDEKTVTDAKNNVLQFPVEVKVAE